MINVVAETKRIEAVLKGSNLQIGTVLDDAGVNRSTWTRWKNGNAPTMSKWFAVQAAVDRALERPRQTVEAAE